MTTTGIIKFGVILTLIGLAALLFLYAARAFDFDHDGDFVLRPSQTKIL